MKFKLICPDMKVVIDGQAMFLSANAWSKAGIDDHLHAIHLDKDGGELEWCVNPVSGRKPANEKWAAPNWNPYFTETQFQQLVVLHDERKKEMEAANAAAQAKS